MTHWHTWTNNGMEYHHGFLMWCLLEAQTLLVFVLVSAVSARMRRVTEEASRHLARRWHQAWAKTVCTFRFQM